MSLTPIDGGGRLGRVFEDARCATRRRGSRSAGGSPSSTCGKLALVELDSRLIIDDYACAGHAAVEHRADMYHQIDHGVVPRRWLSTAPTGPRGSS